MTDGRELRLRRLFPPGGRKLFAVPLDHSVSMGPIDGLEDSARTVRELQTAGADAFVVTRGAAQRIVPVLQASTLLGVHLSASTALAAEPDHKILVGSVEDALAAGADFVSVQVNFGLPQEPAMLRDLGVVVEQSRRCGVPVLCMAYVKKGPEPSPLEIAHAARAVADLGADVVKTSYPGSTRTLRRVVELTPAPVLLGGGIRADDPESILAVVRSARDAGAAGICIGRNLFQRHPLGPFARKVSAILRANSGRGDA
ncbi:MAG TPA: hypothetical protein VGV89_03955 [Thermoplasmata archaeon]|nr:hypothetical protein [Thermoplasmata archaeon]